MDDVFLINSLLTVQNLISIKNTTGHLIFWALVFLINSGPHWAIYSSPAEFITTVGMLTSLQFMVAYVTVKFCIPLVLEQGRTVLFFMCLIGLTLLASEINIAIRYLYLEPTYPMSYERFLELYGDKTFRERMVSLWTLKYIFFTKIPMFLYPAVILTANTFHQKQRDMLKLSEQKQKAELEALKNQLNPHFIFNTLNNLYTLALKKSDLTPVVIEKLSNILDYVLYRCHNQFVPLSDEIELIDNYIDLEKIRFGDRIDIWFQHNVNNGVHIAPLILLTLLENACKHSTREELDVASIQIQLDANDSHIAFEIINSIPQHQDIAARRETDPIGLANLKKQLHLIYGQRHQLNMRETDNEFTVHLEISNP